MGKRSHELRHGLAILLLVLSAVAAILGWLLHDTAHFTLARPWALGLLLAIPLAFWIELVLRRKRVAPLGFSSLGVLSRLRQGLVARLRTLPSALRIVALALFALALARPQTQDQGSHVEVEGIDIVLALDLSNSMEAMDLRPNRLEAAKRVIDDFIRRRRSDRIGLVVFGKEAFTQCPLTLDYSVLRTMLAELKINMIDGQATAIGNALGVSLARLRRSDAKSRVVILLTDGDNNAGNVTPREAARYAAAMKVKVFTILMGPREVSAAGGRDAFGRPIQVQRQFPVNPKLLEEIAAQTGGRAYLATDQRALAHNFEQILEELDKSTRRDVGAVYSDAFWPFALFGLLLLLGEAVLRLTRFREFP